MGGEACIELRVTGPLADPGSTAPLRQRLELALAKRQHVVVNLHDCPTLSPETVGVLVAMDERFDAASLDLKLFAARGAVRQALYLEGDLDV